MREEPSPDRARERAATAASWTASGSLPSTTTGCSPYAAARSAAGFGTAVTEPIAVYSMYRLFSHTNTTGSFHTAARFSASWKAPMLVVPSPKKQTAAWQVPRYWADQAALVAIGRCAPMMT